MDERVKAFYAQLKSQRDELRVQIHLGAADLRDEWKEAEKKWQRAERKFDEMAEEAGEAAKETKATLNVIGEELASTYKRIRERLHD